jgi:two-component system alkaline phosphatase synthesis response regulator PhoP
MATIFVVDDDDDIRELLKYNLEINGHEVITCENGLTCKEKLKERKPDLILLDVMMPEMDGIELCESMKSSIEYKDILVCFLTARNEDYSQIAGLESGGDDYVAKPIKPKVLISRINALLRRKELSTPKNEQIIEIQIDRERYRVVKNGLEIHLPRKEFELLALLSSRPNFVFKRDFILETVWGTEIIVGDRTIDVHVRKLREKIGDKYISTVKGVGYKFNNNL